MSKDNQMRLMDEFKDQGFKHVLSKHEYDLYKEEDDLKLPIIRVKHFKLAGNAERWKIFSDNKVIFIVEGSKLNKTERAFLRGIDGINFLIGQQKLGIKSFNMLKITLKQIMKKGLDKKR